MKKEREVFVGTHLTEEEKSKFEEMARLGHRSNSAHLRMLIEQDFNS